MCARYSKNKNILSGFVNVHSLCHKHNIIIAVLVQTSLSACMDLMLTLITHCTQDIISGVVFALLFFAVSVPMEFYSGEWAEINGIIEFAYELTDNSNNEFIDISAFRMLFNLDKVIPASGATAVSCYIDCLINQHKKLIIIW